MTGDLDRGPDPVFRPEALDYLAAQRGPGELVRVSARWMDATYWVFLLLVAAGGLAALLVRVDGEPLLSLVLPVVSNLHG